LEELIGQPLDGLYIWKTAGQTRIKTTYIHGISPCPRRRARCKNRQRAIQRDQIRRDGLVIDSHKAHGQSHALLAGKVRLVKADDTLTTLAGANQQNAGFAILDADFVRWNERDAAPRHELRSK
jgi:hypothetical protein